VNRGPLDGYQGIVLTQAWAGTYCTELLAFMGADVVQVEVRKRPDSWRGTYDAPMPRRFEQVETAEHPWNCNFLYNSVNLNKRCVTLDLQDPRGLEAFRRLLPFADFVAENFSPRVLGNLGIGYEEMLAIKPDVILCSLSAYGHDGPWANVPGIGGTIEPTSGMSALLGYPGGPPINSGQMYPDAVAGLSAFGAVMAALRHRDRTGEGQYIDLSMQEANLAFAGDAALEYLRTGRQRERMGNRHHAMSPHGIYPCAGVERWVAIACEDDGQWRSLVGVLGLEPAGFETVEGRKAREDELDAAIGTRTAGFERDELVAKLRDAGVVVAPVLNGLEVAEDRGLRERGVVREVSHAEVGVFPQATIPWRYSRSGQPPVTAAPVLGGDSFEVLSEFLGMSREEYEELAAAGVTGIGPP
jgi:crotonobetainyl-CoA:carnitine CoA-transferase CaiB-like acyl-CoA transferase